MKRERWSWSGITIKRNHQYIVSSFYLQDRIVYLFIISLLVMHFKGSDKAKPSNWTQNLFKVIEELKVGQWKTFEKLLETKMTGFGKQGFVYKQKTGLPEYFKILFENATLCNSINICSSRMHSKGVFLPAKSIFTLKSDKKGCAEYQFPEYWSQGKKSLKYFKGHDSDVGVIFF